MEAKTPLRAAAPLVVLITGLAIAGCASGQRADHALADKNGEQAVSTDSWCARIHMERYGGNRPFVAMPFTVGQARAEAARIGHRLNKWSESTANTVLARCVIARTSPDQGLDAPYVPTFDVWYGDAQQSEEILSDVSVADAYTDLPIT
jgi:hypothetical protein